MSSACASSTQSAHRHGAKRANRGSHLIKVEVTAGTEVEVGLDLCSCVRVEHTFEVFGDQLDDLLTANGAAGCCLFVVHQPVADALAL